MKDWYLGLDIGTNSVGWCASDKECNILTKNSKLQCGTRLFNDAQDASERRVFRSTRRRFARRKMRIHLLQNIFDSAITTKDASFFIRMNESYRQDNNGNGIYPLFMDAGFADRNYYSKFPTIYHLRKHLLENDETDPRLLYLACHHIIKYRGHFLFERFNTDSGNDGYAEILARFGENTTLESLQDNKGIYAALKGNKIQLEKIFVDDNDDIKEKISAIKDQLTKDYNFKNEKFEELQKVANSILSDEQSDYVLRLKNLYDRIQLDDILNGSQNIPSAMVKHYDEHKADLKLLKAFIKTNLPKEYDKVFRKNGNYSNYVGLNNTRNKETNSHDKKCKTDITTINYEEFLKSIASVIDNAKNKDNYDHLKNKIDKQTLCQNHNTKNNAYLPYQLQEAELKKILERQKDNFPFLANTDKYGSVTDKIISLLTFRIPYYVGPLSEAHKGKFTWIEKKKGHEGEKVLPWNFSEIVDTEASGEAFITRMTAKCTYLKNEDVIPKASLLYQRYMLLNDLNNLKINGNRISQDLKQLLFHGICQEETSLSKTKIKEYLASKGKIQNSDTVGKENENDTAFNSSLSSLIKLKRILGESYDEEMCENIIKWHTVFGDEKNPVVYKIKTVYGGKLTDNQITELKKISFKGWAQFSKKFLNGIVTTSKKTGETALTIIKILEETNLNLMEVINSQSYTPTFIETIAKENTRDTSKLDYDGLVADLYCSPTVKRSIWQAILVCKELAKINGSKPKKVFIEVTRGEDKKKKGKMTQSRLSQVKTLLEKSVNDSQDIGNLLEELNQKKEDELRSDRYYLYFTQLGKCAYSGNAIDLSRLQENLYDIDHIYPQSIIKDDSLTNRVLVQRSHNADKSDTYPIKSSIQDQRRDFWKMLQRKGLISTEKLRRLTCTQSLTQEQVGAFINRQLVSTNQAVKETANALKLLFGNDTKIVYSKAGNVSEFRHTYNLVKCREVNNLHHAHDAYLNIVVGSVWDSVLSECNFWKETGANTDKGIDKLFKYDIDGIWKVAYLEKINAYLFDNKKYLGKYPVTFRPYIKKGAFYDQTIHPKGKAQFPLRKGLPTEQYGGYKTGTNAYNCVIEHDDKKKGRIREAFSLPVRYLIQYSEDALYEKIAKEKNLSNHKVIVKRILIDAVLEVNGFRYLARTGDLQCPATVEWMPDKQTIRIIHDIVKYLKLVTDKQITPNIEIKDDIIFAGREKNKHQKEGKVISRENNLKIYDAIIEQIKKPFFAQYPFAKKVSEGTISRKIFDDLSTHQQTEQLIEMLKAITFNGKNFDATKIGGKSNETPVYKVTSIYDKNIYMITQSATGLFESKIEINKKNN